MLLHTFLKMDYFILSYIFVCILYSVHADECDYSVTDIEHNKIDIDTFCDAKKPCVVKCCGKNEVIHWYNATYEMCESVSDLMKEFQAYNVTEDFFGYSDLKIYNGSQVSSKRFDDFTFLQSEMFMNTGKECVRAMSKNHTKRLLESGSLTYYLRNNRENWNTANTPTFCVERIVTVRANAPKATLTFRIMKSKEMVENDLFVAIGFLISAVFLVAVLVVYSALPALRNIQGMLMMAYVATLMCFYTLEGAFLLYIRTHQPDCTLYAQIKCYLLLASFFWLKLMCFDIWWTFRGTRKAREIHRRGIHFKFMVYASYAFGMPALLTIFSVCMDNIDLPDNVAKIDFSSCMANENNFYYLYIPLMILTGCNCLLFLMTMYNIWLIKRNIANFDKASKEKNNKNRNMFVLYLKLCSLMGVSWIVEFIQQISIPAQSIPLWLYIVLNAYNVFLGVIIFFLLVFKKSIFVSLCKRFNIENRWTRERKVTSSIRSELSKASKYSRSYSRTRSTDDSDLEDRPNDADRKNSSLNPQFTTTAL